MTMTDLIHEARDEGVRLWLKDGQLAVNAKGGVPPALLARIKAHKTELMDWLAQLSDDAAAMADRIVAAPVIGPEPLAYSQTRLWVIDRMENSGGLYNVPVVLHLAGPLDQHRLRAALASLTARHAVLRTVFRGADDVVQIVQPPAPFDLHVTDLTAQTAPEAAAAQRVAAEAIRPFDLATDPMLRAHLLRLGPQDHRLLLTLHHIATDGWSNGILLRELALIYGGAELPAPRLQFTDYARWQREVLAKRGGDLAEWWARRLEGVPDLHDLSTDHPRPPVLSGAGDRVTGHISAEVAQALRDLAQARGVTLFTLLLAAYGALLHRVSGMEDLVIGTPVAGRGRDELKDLVGFLVNTLPLRLQPKAEMSFADFLMQSRDTVTAAFAHQDLPFEMIVERINPPRSLANAPLVQLAFTLSQGQDAPPSFGDLAFSVAETPLNSAKFELALGVADQPDGLALDWNFATDLFVPESVAGLNRAFTSMLVEIAARPDTPLAALPVLSTAEHLALLQLGRGPDRDDGMNPPRPYQLIEHFAAMTPDKVAVLDGDQRLTYGAMNAWANRLARHLLALGVRPGDAVGLGTGRNRWMIAAMVAINKAGAAAVQLPVDAPQDRLLRMLANCNARHVLTLADQPHLISLPGALAVDDDADWRDLDCSDLPAPAADLAYIVYTSGTTGTPKGAMNTHLGLLNMCRWQAGDFGHDADSTQTVAANPAFDAIMWEIWPTLTVGGTIAMLHPADLGDVAALQTAIDRIAPTHFWLPTGLMEAMCAAGLHLPASVRSVSTGGDRLQGYCLPKGCGIPLANIYGPSEAAVITVCCVLDESETQNVPIGRPVPNVSAYILDDALRLLPRGSVGELCISGPFVGPGYINDAELTARKYVRNPFARPGHEVLYRTGDLARWLPDGRMECLGRTDFQVKIRGYRIEPQEIASVLLEQPGVRQAFVDVVEGADKRLVAFCVADESQDGAVLEPTLRLELARLMPSYMMPDRFVWLPVLPLTDRGKIDRRALAALAPATPRQVNTASPRDDIELKLYHIWSGVLLHPEIGLRDNFFDIGGNSLSAIKIVHQVNQGFCTAFAVTEIIAHPTIEALGGLIRAGKAHSKPQNPICFRAGAGKLNVICIHPGGGTAFAYLSLAKALPEDFGVWGVQAVGVQPGEDFLPDIGAMADHYMTLVQHLLDRPFVLTGASFGGFVAYEMVRRLKLAGNDLGTAVLLDSMGSDDPALIEDAGEVTAEVFRQKLVTYNGMYPGIDDAQIAQYHRIYNHHTLSSRRWNFRPTDGRVLLVQAIKGRTKLQIQFLRFFWRLRAKGPFLFKFTAGDHSTTLEGADVIRVGTIIAAVLEGRLMRRGGRV